MKSDPKKYITQFLPQELEEFSKEKYFYFKDKKLKSSYTIDLIHNNLFKYFYTKDNSFILSSIILKDKYGYLYNYYIKHLINLKILFLLKNHQKGKRSRVYKLNERIFDSKILRFQNKDKTLLKKRRNNILNNKEIDNSPILKEVRDKLIHDLNCVKIDYESSIDFLNSFETESEVYNKNLFTIESIRDNDIFYHFDTYGRFHTNFTILKSFIRKNFLTIDRETTVEIDIKNSQPLFLNKIIHTFDQELLDNPEINFYGELTYNGEFYNYLQVKLDIKDKSVIKNLVYKILFGKNYSNDLNNKFKKIFPKIYEFIKLYKKKNMDYKSLSYELQKVESNFIYNKVILDIHRNYPNIKLITCHDSIICKKSDSDIVRKIFDQYLEEEFNFLSSSSSVFNI